MAVLTDDLLSVRELHARFGVGSIDNNRHEFRKLAERGLAVRVQRDGTSYYRKAAAPE